MTRTTWTIWIMAVLMAILVTVAISQVAPAPEKSFEGELIKVDAAMKTITVRSTEGKDVTQISFRYSDDTQIVGGDHSVQGLTGKNGATIKVTYRVDRGTNEATRIEWIEKKQ